MRRLLEKRWLIGAVTICVLIFAQSSTGSPTVGDGLLEEAVPVVAHVLLYGALAFCLSRHFGRLNAVTAVAAALLATLYGVSDEIHQSFVPSRTASAGDVAADFAGACLGVAFSAIALTFGPAPPETD